MFGGLVDSARLGDWAALVKEKGQALVEESKLLADKLSLDRLQEEEAAAAAGAVGSAAAVGGCVGMGGGWFALGGGLHA